jgi:uncharacterized protein (TIGR02452 family)
MWCGFGRGRLMSGRFREIAQQTVAIAEAGWYRNGAGERVGIRAAVTAAVAGTRHHLPGETIAVAMGSAGSLAVEVTGESTLAAARRLGDGVACLVFASAKNPGGGFLGGAVAQEESIARSSALYPCLLAVPDFYAYHRRQGDPRYSDRVIYSPAVPVFRDDQGELLDRPHHAAFLTAAAPNLGAIVRSRGRARDVSDVLRSRARQVLRVAAAHGHRTLVLGAWGCGVFRNDPTTVAHAFADAMLEVDRFERIVFAVRDLLPGAPVRSTFEAVFSGAVTNVVEDWVMLPDESEQANRRSRRLRSRR